MTSPPRNGHQRTPATECEGEQRPQLRSVPAGERHTKAGVRADARAIIAAETNTAEVVDANPSSPTERARMARRLRHWITPPNPKSTPPPTWDQLRWHGEHGRQVPKSGWPRTLAIGWSCLVAQPVRALAIWLDWIARSPSRFLVAFVLYALLAHVPGLTWLPWLF